MSRSQARSQEVWLQTTFTSTDPAASRMASSPSSQRDTYNKFWDPKYKEYNIIKNFITIEITDILRIIHRKSSISKLKLKSMMPMHWGHCSLHLSALDSLRRNISKHVHEHISVPDRQRFVALLPSRGSDPEQSIHLHTIWIWSQNSLKHTLKNCAAVY